jgi:hypothetical protein
VLNSGFCDPAMPTATDDDGLTEWCTGTVGNGQAGGLAPADPDGVAELVVRAGVGAATKTSAALGTTHDWRCDVSSPCRLPLVITPPDGDSVFDVSTLLTYRDDDPTAGCGGKATDEIPSSAPDRLTEQWVAWTVADCAGRGTATAASFENDGRALGEFTDGTVDLAYSAVAPGTTGFGTGTRAAVATPVALNATVIAAAGFYPATSSVPGRRLWKHVTDVKMTEVEATALLSGHLGLDEDLQNALINRNPQLKAQTGAIGFTAPSALAGPQATTYVVSRRYSAKYPDGWTYPNSKAKFGDMAGKPLGSFADYNTLTNSLGILNLSTGKPQFVGEIYRKLAEKPEAVSLITFYLTDLATSRQLGLSPVAIGSDAGGYVLPDDASIRAAATDLVTGADGFSAPKAPSADTTAATPYPLTYAEYAVTPAERLVDADCKERTNAKAAIQRWLGFLTTGGQDPAVLATSGMVPLTPALLEQAKASVAKVGATAPTTGPCAPEEETPTTTTPTTTPDPGTVDPGTLGDTNIPTDVPPASDTSLRNATNTPVAADVAAAAPAATRKSSSHTIDTAKANALNGSIPRLPGPLGSPVVAGTLSLPALVALVTAVGRGSAGTGIAWPTRPPAIPTGPPDPGAS